MNFSGIPEKSWVGRFLRSLLRKLPPGTQVPILQGRLRGKKWIVGAGVHGYWLGSFEHEKQKIFTKLIGKDMVVFDIGAHVGFYSLLASELVGKQGVVIAFEPLPRNLSYLRKHIEINAIKNVRVMDAAVSDKCGEAYFKEGPDSYTGSINENGNIKVKLVTLDNLVSSCEIPLPNLIKMDIEGAELQALYGAVEILTSKHPAILVALHGNGEKHALCLKFLQKLGYGMERIGKSNIEFADEVLATI